MDYRDGRYILFPENRISHSREIRYDVNSLNYIAALEYEYN